MLKITQRDEELFKYLYTYKVASGHQIRRDVFFNASQSSTSRRLKGLIGEKWITSMAFSKNFKTLKAYSLTGKAFDRYVADIFKGMTRRQFKSNSPMHDMDLLDIKYRLSKKKDVKVTISENLLQSGADFLDAFKIGHLIKHNPDGIVKVEVDGELYTFCLEYDSSAKSKSRYEDFLKKYYFDNEVTAVFFIYEEKSFFKSIFSLERELFSRMTPKIYYCSLKDILFMEKELTFVNVKNSHLKIS